MTMTKANPDREERRRRQKEIADQFKASGALDEIFAKIDAGEALTGEQGLIGGMLKAALERGLEAELTEHVGYERGAVEASLHENSRNGMSPKTVATEIGDVELAIPRDRNGTFTPMLVPKGQRRLDGLDGMIISLYAGGMTLRDIQHHLASTIGTEISHETISKIVDQIGEEILIWQQRPLEALYPVIFLDAIVVKVRDGGHVRNKAAHLAIGIDMEGIKHVLGIWVQANEGATFWAAVCAELAAFEATELGRRYPSTSKAFRDAWERFTPFLAFPLELRRVIYTTNSIESLNYQLRKVTKNRGHFPNDHAVVKLLWLAICDIEDKRARDRAKERGLRAEQRKAPGRLVEGQVTTNWKQALQQLSLVYPDRINPHL